jgi:hypothetical protein
MRACTSIADALVGGCAGDHLATFHAFEHLYVRYPHLPARALPAAVASFAGPESLAAWGRTVGLHNVLRWTPAVRLPAHPHPHPHARRHRDTCLRAYRGIGTGAAVADAACGHGHRQARRATWPA